MPVILLSARSLVEHQIEEVEKGADAYVTKPFHPEFLRATVHNLLESRRKLRECFSAGNILPQSTASPDDLFLRKSIELVEANLANTEYDIEAFCKGMGVSNTLLYTKLKAPPDSPVSGSPASPLRQIIGSTAHTPLAYGVVAVELNSL